MPSAVFSRLLTFLSAIARALSAARTMPYFVAKYLVFSPRELERKLAKLDPEAKDLLQTGGGEHEPCAPRTASKVLGNKAPPSDQPAPRPPCDDGAGTLAAAGVAAR